mmetsp:Transcript_6751/g.22116  ORF Transcript_6751/g.22116 Transcript_6751/m.22116 type:complete len:221 (+) Transcript_6751:549-1211(+)
MWFIDSSPCSMVPARLSAYRWHSERRHPSHAPAGCLGLAGVTTVAALSWTVKRSASATRPSTRRRMLVSLSLARRRMSCASDPRIHLDCATEPPWAVSRKEAMGLSRVSKRLTTPPPRTRRVMSLPLPKRWIATRAPSSSASASATSDAASVGRAQPSAARATSADDSKRSRSWRATAHAHTIRYVSCIFSSSSSASSSERPSGTFSLGLLSRGTARSSS